MFLSEGVGVSIQLRSSTPPTEPAGAQLLDDESLD